MERSFPLSGRTTVFALLFIFVVSLALTACGGSDDDSEMSLDGDDGMAYSTAQEAQDESAPAMAADMERPESEAAQFDQDVSGQIDYERLVIRTAQITLTVDDTVAATASARNIAATRGGFVFSSTTYTQDDQQYAQLTLRVPSEFFDDVISDLRAAPWVTEIVREESSSQDVSAEFVDNESRLAALEETQRRYMALLEDADTIESILRLESELTNVRSQIETIKGRQNYLSEMTDFSTITVTLHPVDGEPEEDPDEGFALARLFQDAWDRSSGALAGLAETVIVLGIFIVFLAPLGVLAYAVYRFARRMANRPARESVTRHPVD